MSRKRRVGRGWGGGGGEAGGLFSKENENVIDPALSPAQWMVIDGCDRGGSSTPRWRLGRRMLLCSGRRLPPCPAAAAAVLAAR